MLPEPGWTYQTRLEEDSPLPHLWIVLTSHLDHPEGKVVAVNLTTKRSWSDPTTELDPSDHPFVERPTVVDYPKADFYLPQVFVTATVSGDAVRHADCDSELLERIRGGAVRSDQTPQRVKHFLEGQDL